MTLKIKLYCLAFLLGVGSCLLGQLRHTNKELPCLNKNFNVHVHLILDSLGQGGVTEANILAVFEQNRKYFSPICMDFTVCKIDTIYNYNFDSIPTNAEYEEIHTKFSSQNRINIYIITNTYVSNNNKPQPICGLAGKAIYLNKSCMGSLTHELGHFFGLAHTFEGSGEENVDGSNCTTAGDRICDTPADPYPQFDKLELWINKRCEFINEKKDANGAFYIPHVANIMSYYGCPCQEFTRGQYLRMVETYFANHKNLW